MLMTWGMLSLPLISEDITQVVSPGGLVIALDMQAAHSLTQGHLMTVVDYEGKVDCYHPWAGGEA